jgi:hypothetical protein
LKRSIVAADRQHPDTATVSLTVTQWWIAIPINADGLASRACCGLSFLT